MHPSPRRRTAVRPFLLLPFAALVLATCTAARTTAGARPARSPAPRQAEYAGYLFTYFTGEGTADGEQVHFALSEGNDALRWRELNGGAPVLTSTQGDRGVRDPFLLRSPDRDRYFLIATDLRMYGNGDWEQVQRTGSRSLAVWESTDLVTWSDQRVVQVAPPTAGNVWAPKAHHDPERDAYVVFWASKLYAEEDPDHTGDTYHRMLYATTRDFVTFSEPQVWHDPGHSVIDSTLVREGDTYYRFTKDERSPDSGTACAKFLTQERSHYLLDPSYELVAEGIGSPALSQGEGPAVFRSNTEEKWYLFIDEFGGRGYVPFETTDLASGRWTPSLDARLPRNSRHGTVLPVTQEEYDRLAAAHPAADAGSPLGPARPVW